MNTIRLYALQQHPVPEILDREGICFSKPEYVRRKYGESAGVFLNNYDWFVREAARIAAPPSGAEYPYWAFRDLYNLDITDSNDSYGLFTLDVPMDMAVFFDAADWNKIMQFRYLGETDDEEAAFNRKLKLYGTTTYKVLSTPHYPDLRAEIEESWKKLFRHDNEIRQGNYDCCSGGVQAGLWCLNRDWICK